MSKSEVVVVRRGQKPQAVIRARLCLRVSKEILSGRPADQRDDLLDVRLHRSLNEVLQGEFFPPRLSPHHVSYSRRPLMWSVADGAGPLSLQIHLYIVILQKMKWSGEKKDK